MSEEVLFFAQGLRYRWPQRRRLRRWLQEVVEAEGKCLSSLRLIICSEVFLRDLHRRYMDMDTDTDVLTFDCSEDAAKVIDGEVYLGLAQLRRQAKVWEATFFEELSRVAVHGVLHLCGYDDQTAAQKKKMRSAEEHYLRVLRQIDLASAARSTPDVSRETSGGICHKSLNNNVDVSRETSGGICRKSLNNNVHVSRETSTDQS